jgi:phage gpG-like protein
MIDWAGVHNDGGVAGKGARIPERKFLEWTPERLAKFVEIAQQYVIEKLEKKKAQ